VQLPFSLRRFRADDLDRIMRINRMCLPENYSPSFFMDIYEKSPETFIVAEMDGVIVGYVMCRIERGLSSLTLRPFSIAKKGHIISIAVLPEHRGKGVGHALVEGALEAMLTSYGADSCYLEVRVSNSGAIGLYRSLEFEVEKTARGYYSDGESAHIMSKKLGSED
jgi:ribosomal-protein-alanine N-acetyltransferase